MRRRSDFARFIDAALTQRAAESSGRIDRRGPNLDAPTDRSIM
jgi:hypothetical protein